MYDTFISQNIAVKGARRVGIYDISGHRVGQIPLDSLTPPNSEKRLYSFGALSDVHYQYSTAADDFKNAMAYLNNTEDVELICICGDLTESGTDAELTEYKNAVSAHSPNTPVYAITGNHDAYQGLHNNIQVYTGQPLCYTITHGKDIFIMVGTSGGNEKNFLNTNVLQWLYEALEQNRNKRCFLFFHVLLDGGCGDAANVYWGDKIRNETTSVVFKSLLQHYRNTIFFHGHSHMRFRLQEIGDNANYDNCLGCHSVHIPSISVPRDSSGTDVMDYTAGSEGYVVDVYETGIHLRGRDFAKGAFLPIASYWLDTTLQTIPARTYTDSTGTITT